MMTDLCVEGGIPASSPYIITGRRDKIAAPFRVQAFQRNRLKYERSLLKNRNETVATIQT